MPEDKSSLYIKYLVSTGRYTLEKAKEMAARFYDEYEKRRLDEHNAHYKDQLDKGE